MKLRSSKKRRPKKGESGIVIVLMAIVTVVLLLSAGLAVDLGLAHVTMARLSKAVDAGALSGARHSTEVVADIKDIAMRVATANYGASGRPGARATYDVSISNPSPDTYAVRVHGMTDSPAFFSRLMGKTSLDVAAVAEATRWPLDLSLVLDLSGSLKRNAAFDDMQDASIAFLESFNDDVDQFGIVTYSTWATQAMPMQKRFKGPGRAVISGLDSISDTNIDEGLRLGKTQLDTATPRPKALKILVLFTDGRPTAFADALRIDGPNKDCPSAPNPLAFASTDADANGVPDCWGGVVATGIAGPYVRGVFRADSGMKVIDFLNNGEQLEPNGSANAS
jgi:Flp pilus assembly protein TadG